MKIQHQYEGVSRLVDSIRALNEKEFEKISFNPKYVVELEDILSLCQDPRIYTRGGLIKSQKHYLLSRVLRSVPYRKDLFLFNIPNWVYRGWHLSPRELGGSHLGIMKVEEEICNDLGLEPCPNSSNFGPRINGVVVNNYHADIKLKVTRTLASSNKEPEFEVFSHFYLWPNAGSRFRVAHNFVIANYRGTEEHMPQLAEIFNLVSRPEYRKRVILENYRSSLLDSSFEGYDPEAGFWETQSEED